MKKVLILGPFPKPISGVSLANKVVKEILDNSTTFTVDKINTSYPEFQDKIGSFSFKKLWFFLKVNFSFFKVFNSDIIYITPGQTFLGVTKYALFILTSSLFKKELIIHVHGNYLAEQYKQLTGFKKNIFYFLLSKFKKGIVLSASLKGNLTPFINNNKIYVLNNFAESYLAENLKEIDNSMLKITYLSNLMEEKGVFYLLDALQELEKNNINYEAKIAGNIDVKLKDEIISKITNLKNTTYLGLVYNTQKKDLLEWGNTFVLPTFYKMEGQPISILEALATNNIIVSTKHAGIPDIIQHDKNGYLVEKESVHSLVDVFTYLSKNISEIDEMINENKQYFADNFTIEKFTKEILAIFLDDAKT